jgi:hypothetical protein
MTPLERWIVWIATAAVTGTGTAYGILRYLLATTDEFGLVSHPAEPLALKLHVLAAPLLVFAVGMIAVRHVLAHLRQGARMGRRSGLTALVTIVPMIASGYAIQVVTSERWLVVLAWVHGVTSVLFALGAVSHFAALRGSRKRAEQMPRAPEALPESAPGAGG